jgi:hypothetical protein
MRLKKYTHSNIIEMLAQTQCTHTLLYPEMLMYIQISETMYVKFLNSAIKAFEHERHIPRIVSPSQVK